MRPAGFERDVRDVPKPTQAPTLPLTRGMFTGVHGSGLLVGPDNPVFMPSPMRDAVPDTAPGFVPGARFDPFGPVKPDPEMVSVPRAWFAHSACVRVRCTAPQQRRHQCLTPRFDVWRSQTQSGSFEAAGDVTIRTVHYALLSLSVPPPRRRRATPLVVFATVCTMGVTSSEMTLRVPSTFVSVALALFLARSSS